MAAITPCGTIRSIMPGFLISISFLLFSAQAENNPQQLMNFTTPGIESNQIISRLAFLSGSQVVAPYVDVTIDTIETLVAKAQNYLNIVDKMINSLQNSPQMESLVARIRQDITVASEVATKFERRAKRGGEIVKITSECAAIDQAARDQLYSNASRVLTEIITDQKDALMDLMAAAQSIQEQINNLEAIEIKIIEPVLTGEMDEAMFEAISHRKEVEKHAFFIERTFISAWDDFQIITLKSLHDLQRSIDELKTNGAQVLARVRKCISPKLHKTSGNIVVQQQSSAT